MLEITKLINSVALTLGKLIDGDVDKLNQKAYIFSLLSEKELQQKCHDRTVNIKENSIWSYIISKIPFIPKKVNDNIIENLALGVAAFNKYPADLSNTTLYPSQIKAALVLTQSCVLQMDTGEGKTYALLPAVYTLSCKYNKVYILCANEYLAQRDAIRTKNYWDFVGLNVQYCNNNDSYNGVKWEGDVIYTTLTTLLFKGLHDDLYKIPYQRRIAFDAIVIDEIDSVLLDNDLSHSISQEIKSDIYNWEIAIRYAQTLVEKVDINTNKENLTATLTPIGEEKIKQFLSRNSLSLLYYGQFRKATEISFVSLSLEEDKDYVFTNGVIYAVNRLNGEIEFNKIMDWIIPLELLKGLKPRSNRILLHKINPRIFLNQFDHISGMSGSAIEDSVEYYYTYSLPTMVIPPRVQKQKGLCQDQVYKSTKEGIDAICRYIIWGVEQHRPILVGTQNIQNAILIYKLICDKLKNSQNVKINLITGKNDKNIAQIYQSGGEVGSIIIATQLSGRGVDIRLTKEAKENGGLVLLGLERAMDIRHDKQFIGRAGRQGDPFTAQFIITLESQLLKHFNSKYIISSMDKLGFEEGEMIQHSMISKSILRAQNQVKEYNFYNRRAQDYATSIEKNIYFNIKNWLTNLNIENQDPTMYEHFFLFVIDHFIKTNLNNAIKDNLNSQQAENIVKNISEMLNIDILNSIYIEGKNKNIVYNYIRENLFRIIDQTLYSKDKITKDQIILFKYLDSRSRYNFIKCKISNLKKTTRKYNNNNSHFNDMFDEIASKIAYTNIFQINSSTDIKYIYRLLNYLEKNISNLSENKYEEALNITSQIENCWINSISNFKENLQKRVNRDTYSIAFWTIISAEIRYHDFKEVYKNITKNESLNGLQYYRVLSDGLVAEWDKIESGLSTSILQNILANPISLDDLFIYQDNKIDNSKNITEEPELVKEWDTIKNSTVSVYSKSNTDYFEQKMISEFIAQSETKIGLGFEFNIKSLEYLLKEFLSKNPISSLHYPDKIITALKQWKIDEIRGGVSESRIETNHRWIKEFLMFISKKNIIVMPSFKHVISSTIKKIAININDYKVIIPAIQLFTWALLFILLSIYGNWYHPFKDYFGSSCIKIIDILLCAGWLQQGIVTAPIFLLYLLSNYPFKDNMIMKYTSALGCSIVLTLLSMQSYNINNVTLGIISCVSISVLYLMSISVIRSTEKSLNLSLISIWILYCISNVLISFAKPDAILLELVFIIVLLYYCLLHKKINRVKIQLLSSQVTGSYTNFETTNFRKYTTIEGDTKSIPHIYAFIFSYLIFIAISNTSYIESQYDKYILIFSYLIIILLITNEIIKKKFSIKLWKNKLNLESQMIITTNSSGEIKESDIDKTLTILKNRLLRKAIFLQICVLTFCTIVLRNYHLYDSEYPLSLVILFLAFLFGEHIIRFIKQISELLIFSGKMTNDNIDFQDIKELDEDKTFMQKIRGYFNPFIKTRRFLSILFIIIYVIIFIIKVYDKISKLD